MDKYIQAIEDLSRFKNYLPKDLVEDLNKLKRYVLIINLSL